MKGQHFQNPAGCGDGSTFSDAALKEAMGIAKCSGSTLIALSAARDNTEIPHAQALVNKVVEIGK